MTISTLTNARSATRPSQVVRDAITVRLNELSPGEIGAVIEVPAMALLPSLGIREGKQLRVVAKSIAGGPILVSVDQRTIAVDRAIAQQIHLEVDE